MAGVRNIHQPKEVHEYEFYSKYIGLGINRTGFYGMVLGSTVIPLETNKFTFHSKDDIILVIEGRVDLRETPTNTGIGNLFYQGYGFLVVDGNVMYDGRLGSGGEVTKSYVDLNDALTLQAAKDYTDSKSNVVGILPYEDNTYNSGWITGAVLEGVVNTMHLLQNGNSGQNLIINPPSTSSVDGAIFGVKDGGTGIVGNAVLSGFSGVSGGYQFVKSGETIIFRCFNNTWSVLSRYNKNFSTNNLFSGLSDVSFTTLGSKHIPYYDTNVNLWTNLPIDGILGYAPESSNNKVTNLNSPNDTDFPTTATVKNYVDNAVVGLLNDRGSYNPEAGLYPTTGGSGVGGAVRKGDIWYISATGTINGISVTAGSSVRAIANTPGQSDANWDILDVGLGYIPENIVNKTTSIVGNEADVTKYTTAKAVFDYFDVFDKASLIPRFNLKANIASPTLTGIPRAPTATYGGAESNSTQIATTAFVTSAISAIPSYTGTANRITVSSGVIDIASTYVGQTSITTLGTIGAGTWQGTAIADAYIASAATWNAKLSGTLTDNYIPYSNGTNLVDSSLRRGVTSSISGNVSSLSIIGSFTTLTIGTTATANYYEITRAFDGSSISFFTTLDYRQLKISSGSIYGTEVNSNIVHLNYNGSCVTWNGSSLAIGASRGGNGNATTQLDLQATNKGLGLNRMSTLPSASGREGNFGYNTTTKSPTYSTGATNLWIDVKAKYSEVYDPVLIDQALALSGTSYAIRFKPVCDMAVTAIEFYVLTYGSSELFYCGIYDLAGNKLTDGSVTVSAAGEIRCSVTNIKLTGATTYFVVIKDNNGGSNSIAARTVYNNAKFCASIYIGTGALPSTLASYTADTKAPYMAVIAL
jgi:hypothetical protein